MPFSIVQVVYFLFSLAGTVIFVVALVNVAGWPQLRSRGVWLTCLGVKVCAAVGITMLSLGHLAELCGIRGMHLLRGDLQQLVYMLLAAANLAGDGLLLAGLLSVGRVFHAIRRGSETNAPPPDSH